MCAVKNVVLIKGLLRMFVVHRELTGTPEDPQMIINVIGTTGNIYTVTIQRTPICNCPDGSKGNHCKHIIYVSSMFHHLSFDVKVLI